MDPPTDPQAAEPTRMGERALQVTALGAWSSDGRAEEAVRVRAAELAEKGLMAPAPHTGLGALGEAAAQTNTQNRSQVGSLGSEA
ncbi:hypothetical protein [Streptomyces brevispora]|uniref:hypothetical protein n=1 Tax=Streptomyces brevispora TaxID=887462 RepID=UPI0035E1E73E